MSVICGSFLWVRQSPPTIKLIAATTDILLNVALTTITLTLNFTSKVTTYPTSIYYNIDLYWYLLYLNWIRNRVKLTKSHVLIVFNFFLTWIQNDLDPKRSGSGFHAYEIYCSNLQLSCTCLCYILSMFGYIYSRLYILTWKYLFGAAHCVVKCCCSCVGADI